jgi:hypothetical protein
MSEMVSVTIGPREKEREREHKAKMQVVAKLITGSDTPPSWLINLLSLWSFEISWAHNVETMLPKRKELYETLEAIEGLAKRLLELLQSSMTQGFLASGAGRENEAYINDGLPYLSMLMRDAYKAKIRLVSYLRTVTFNVAPAGRICRDACRRSTFARASSQRHGLSFMEVRIPSLPSKWPRQRPNDFMARGFQAMVGEPTS